MRMWKSFNFYNHTPSYQLGGLWLQGREYTWLLLTTGSRMLIILQNVQSQGSVVPALVKSAAHNINKTPGSVHLPFLPSSGHALGLWVLEPLISKWPQ